VPWHFINRYKSNMGLVLKLGLKVPLSVLSGLTKKVKYFIFFKEEMVIVNTELSLYLNPLILKGRVYLLNSS